MSRGLSRHDIRSLTLAFGADPVLIGGSDTLPLPEIKIVSQTICIGTQRVHQNTKGDYKSLALKNNLLQPL